MGPHARSWRLRDGLDDLRIDVATGPVDRQRLGESLRALEQLLRRFSMRDGETTRVLLAVHEQLTGFRLPWSGGSWNVADELRFAARAGRVQVRRVERPTVVLAVEEDDEEPVLGPDSPPTPLEFVRVLLYDSVGKRMPSALDPLAAKVEVRIGGGPNFARAFAGGAVDVDGIAPGFPSSCQLVFSGLEPGDDPVPPFADEAVDAVADDSRPPVGSTVLLTRRQLAGAQIGSLDTTNVFQLRRREADVLEGEHFFARSAVFHPGPPPPEVELRDPDAPVVQGVDVLAACLRDAARAPAGVVLVTGHDPTLAKERADCVKALLTADRDGWLAVVRAHSRPADVQWSLKWAAGRFGWPCDPGDPSDVLDAATARAIRGFQGSYDADFEAGLFPQPNGGAEIMVDGVAGPQTWGAMFDCIQRALHPVQRPVAATLGWIVVDDKHQTYPVELAQIAAPGQDARRWTDLNGPNPTMVDHVHGGWLPPQVGQRIYIPASWSLPAFEAAGYETFPPVTPPPLPPAGPPALSPDAVRSSGCGAHHLLTPDAPGRRAVRRHVEIVFADPDAPPPVVQCGPGDAPCKSRDCELYDPREYDLTYAGVDETIPVGGLIDFFVFACGDDAADAHSEMPSAWGAQLNLGWIIQGDVRRVRVQSPALGVDVDVSAVTSVRACGGCVGSVPLVVPPRAAAGGRAEYRLLVDRPAGASSFVPRVRVTMAGPAPGVPSWTLVPLLVPGAAAIGVGTAEQPPAWWNRTTAPSP